MCDETMRRSRLDNGNTELILPLGQLRDEARTDQEAAETIEADETICLRYQENEQSGLVFARQLQDDRICERSL